MPIPNIPAKHDAPSFITPERFIAYWRETYGLDDREIPPNLVVLYQDTLFRRLRDAGRLQPIVRGVHQVDDGDVGVIGGFGIGAPGTIAMLEEVMVLGARRIITVGTCGGIGPGAQPGDVIMPTAAIRDEGVSYHYAPDGVPALADAGLLDALRARLSHAGIEYREGATWTTDAPYRETKLEIDAHAAAGALAVDMEASAVFTVAAYRGAAAAALFTVSDVFAGDAWDPHFHADPTQDGLDRLVDVAVAVLGA